MASRSASAHLVLSLMPRSGFEPAFEIAQVVYERMPVAKLESNFDSITSSAYSVSLFTDWQGDTVNQVWRKVRVGDDDAVGAAESFMGAIRSPIKLNPLKSMSPDNCTDQMGVPGPGVTACPTSSWALRQATATNSNRNTSCRAVMQSKRCGQFERWVIDSCRTCTSRRFVQLPPIPFG